MSITKWDAARHLKFAFKFRFFQKSLMKSAKSEVNAFILILSQWNTAIKFLKRFCDSRLLLDVVP